MKTKTIETNSATLLVVELPEGLKEIQTSRVGIGVPIEDGSISFVSGNFKPLGFINDITEWVASDLVSNFYLKNYVITLKKLLQTNGILFENHLEKPSIYESWLEDDETIFDGSGQAKECVLYHEAQNQVWDINRVYLFKKLK